MHTVRSFTPLTRTCWVLALLAALVVTSLAAVEPARAQQRADLAPRHVRQLAPDLVPAPGDVCTLRSVALAGGAARAPRLQGPAPRQMERTATITVRLLGPADGAAYEPFPEGARAALRRAAGVWERHVQPAAEIRVEASFEPLEDPDESDERRGRTLAQAGPRYIYASTIAGRRSVYGSAQIDALTGIDQTPGEPDIIVRFNSGRDDWHFGAGRPGPERIDFATVAAHELGHGLGFFGSMTVEDEVGRWGYTFDDLGEPPPGIYDRFARDGMEQALINTNVYPNPSQRLAEALQGEAGGIFFGEVQAGGGLPAGERTALYAPEEWTEGSSYSHLDEDTYPAGDPNALMTPLIGFEEIAERPGPLACGMLADLGWALGPGCEQALGLEPVEIDGLARIEAYPNPFGTGLPLTLHVAAREPQRARVVLYDALGRRVRTLPARSVNDRGYRVFTVRAQGLPAGVYFARVVGEQFTETVKVVLVR